MSDLRLSDVQKFRKASLRDVPKEVFLIPVHGDRPMLSTTRAPGCRWIGRYTEAVSPGDLFGDVQHVLQAEAA